MTKPSRYPVQRLSTPGADRQLVPCRPHDSGKLPDCERESKPSVPSGISPKTAANRCLVDRFNGGRYIRSLMGKPEIEVSLRASARSVGRVEVRRGVTSGGAWIGICPSGTCTGKSS